MDLKKSSLLDTNILIYYFNGSLPIDAKSFVTKIMKQNFNVSIISKMEFLGFNQFTLNEKKDAKDFLSFANVIHLSDSIIDEVIKLKQERKLKLPDAIIAATAIQHNMKLITRNTKDFDGLHLKIINPFSL
jgi:predicted nucleic acid-binding protein